MNEHSRIFVAGHRGMVGSAICRALTQKGFASIVTRSHGELDLTDQQAVGRFFSEEKIDCVVIAAAKVGGIHANNSLPANFIYENLMIECCLIHEAFRAGIKLLLFLGSSCIYPRACPQPMKEEYLLTGPLEPTNEPYAIAKIAGIKLCESYNRQYGTDYRSVMPTNLYGPNDNYNLETSHVLPAMIRKFHLAKLAMKKDWEGISRNEKVFGPIPNDILQGLQHPEGPQVVLWGTGTPMREFLHVEDMAAACCHVMALDTEVYRRHTQPMLSHINVGTGKDHTIREISEIVQRIVGYEGKIVFDTSKPDGTPRKLLDVSRLKALGWQATISIDDGLFSTYQSLLESEQAGHVPPLCHAC
jgi:GDP-L-fucose synthase